MEAARGRTWDGRSHYFRFNHFQKRSKSSQYSVKPSTRFPFFRGVMFSSHNFFYSEISSSWERITSRPKTEEEPLLFEDGQIPCLFFPPFITENYIFQEKYFLEEIEQKNPDFICFQDISSSLFLEIKNSKIIKKKNFIPSFSNEELNETLIQDYSNLIISRIPNIFSIFFLFMKIKKN